MLVKELIKELEKQPQTATVWSQDLRGDVNYEILVLLGLDGEVMVSPV